MRVLISKPQAWYVLEHDGEIFVDGNYNHSFVGYEFLIKLHPEERARYDKEGRAYIDELTRKIQDTVPIALGSASPFVGRNLASTYGQQVLAAVQSWRAAGEGGNAA